MSIDFETLQQLSGGAAKIDVACPLCGPGCKKPSNKSRKVLRIYNSEPGFATFICQRCGQKGHAHDGARRGGSKQIDPLDEIIGAFKATPTIVTKQQDHDAEKKARTDLARWLWRQRRPIAGSIAETYLRKARGYSGPLPETLGFLPPRGNHHPAMIAAFGIAEEPAPGVLDINTSDITGIHLTRLLPDGSGKAETEEDKAKIMIGPSMGQPIVLAPCNDLLGLVIAEGIEDALSAHEVSGRGAWAAGSAGRLPALADAVPSYVECATVIVDDDGAGNAGSNQLIKKLDARGFDVRVEAGGMP